MTAQQNKQLHATLANLNLMSQKSHLVSGFSNGRTEKSSELNELEANELLAYLRTQQPTMKKDGLDIKADKMRKKIISLAWQMNWTYVNKKHEVRCDVKRIDNWCAKYGYIKKESLNDYSYTELTKLLTQFETVVETYINGI